MTPIRLWLPVAAVLVPGMAHAALGPADQALYDSLNKPGAVDGKVAPGLITGSRIDLIVAALEKGGFNVTLAKGGDGAPQISSTDTDRPFAVEFYGCTGGLDCGYIQFIAGWDLKDGIDVAKVESWNGDHVWGQATRDADNDPVLGLSVNLRGGVTPENFADTVKLWADTLDDFKGYIGRSSQ